MRPVYTLDEMAILVEDAYSRGYEAGYTDAKSKPVETSDDDDSLP